MKQPDSLKEYLLAEMRRRHMGVSEFARSVGINHGQISHHISANPPAPSLPFLRKLSQGIPIPLSELLAIAFPELRQETKIDASVQMLARRIMQFPKQTRDMLIRIVESMEQPGNNH